MIFTSLDFVIFAVLFFTVFCRLEARSKRVLLLFASYIFYGWWDWRFLALMLGSTIVDFYVGKLIYGSSLERTRKVYLCFSIFFNLSVLAYFKYANFFIAEFQRFAEMFGWDTNLTSLSIILPLGISFYTFQTMSYSIDVYRRELEPTRNVITFGLFVSFFPQLVAGPIERAKNLITQLEGELSPSIDQLRSGIILFITGLFKKLVLANTVAPIVDKSFSSNFSEGSAPLTIAVVLFAIQIYGDFSGYSDMARGIARCMGVELMQNFNSPYLVSSITDFWRHWHISLSTWIRDYIYIPLGGSRCSAFRNSVNLMMTMLLAGFWHGAGWAYIIWGGFHGALLVIEKYSGYTKQKNVHIGIGKVLMGAVCFLVTCVGWFLFRAGSEPLENQVDILMLRGVGEVFPTSIYGLLVVLVFLFMTLIIQRCSQRMNDSSCWSPENWMKVVVILLATIFCFGKFSSDEFIYFQF